MRVEVDSERFSFALGKQMKIKRGRPNRPGGNFVVTSVSEVEAAYGHGKLVRFRSGERVIYEGYEDLLVTRESGRKTEVIIRSLMSKKRKDLISRALIY